MQLQLSYWGKLPQGNYLKENTEADNLNRLEVEAVEFNWAVELNRFNLNSKLWPFVFRLTI